MMRAILVALVLGFVFFAGCIGQEIGKGNMSSAPVCGNRIIESGEQCELGRPCANSSELCSIDCKCVPPKEPPREVSCAENAAAAANGSSNIFNTATMVCKDDCSSLGQNATCDSATCTCHIPAPPQGNESNATAPAPRCGDGILTAPEACDPGSNSTASCPAGEKCSADCRCAPQLPTHAECDYTRHACIVAQGAGFNQCVFDSDCAQPPHCGNGVREGPELCDGGDRANCASGQLCAINCTCITEILPTEHLECRNQACVTVPGASPNQCSNDSDCRPPQIDCPAYCTGQGYSQSLGGAYPTAAACQQAAQEPQVACSVTCVYTKFYSVTSPAGIATCCCKEAKLYQCQNCPGTSSCPACPATKP